MKLGFGFMCFLVLHDLGLYETLGYMLCVIYRFLYINPESIKHFMISKILPFQSHDKTKMAENARGVKKVSYKTNLFI